MARAAQRPKYTSPYNAGALVSSYMQNHERASTKSVVGITGRGHKRSVEGKPRSSPDAGEQEEGPATSTTSSSTSAPAVLPRIGGGGILRSTANTTSSSIRPVVKGSSLQSGSCRNRRSPAGLKGEGEDSCNKLFASKAGGWQAPVGAASGRKMPVGRLPSGSHALTRNRAGRTYRQRGRPVVGGGGRLYLPSLPSSTGPLQDVTGMRSLWMSQSSQKQSAGSGLTCVQEKCGVAGVCSIAGLKPGKTWVNQDSFIMREKLNEAGDSLFVVLDGHGDLGHVISGRCKDRLPDVVISCSMNLIRSGQLMHQELCSTSNVDCSSSGATCVMCLISGKKITVGNIGDSRCVLAREVNGQLCAVPLSVDHKPDRPDEKGRIVGQGGHVAARQMLVGSGPGGAIRLPMGPARIWYQVRGETMGLAMSRSVGDSIAHAAGVSSQAEIMTHEIDPLDRFLILASDGIWDVIETAQAVKIVGDYIAHKGEATEAWDPQEAADLLTRTARRRWESLSPTIDDITAIVVSLL
jgi:serine/threonine protein phosphatase PrpC